MHRKIISHDDFDGLASAAICSSALGVGRFFFTGPYGISQSRVDVGPDDIVCDLPYPTQCGMWFDHHAGNIEELKHRGIDVSAIPGRFDLKDSCARVVYEYFREAGKELPAHFEDMVAEADIIDAFKYGSVEEWRKETPGRVVSDSLKFRDENPRRRLRFLQRVVVMMRDRPLTQLADEEFIRSRFETYRRDEEKMLKLIEEGARFLDDDENREIIVIDLTHHSRKPNVYKNLAYLLYPDAMAVLEVKNRFEMGRKTNDLQFSMALGFNLNSMDHKKDVGEIMRSLNLGDGHAGAAAGGLRCGSKAEMLKKKEETLSRILSLWKQQV